VGNLSADSSITRWFDPTGYVARAVHFRNSARNHLFGQATLADDGVSKNTRVNERVDTQFRRFPICRILNWKPAEHLARQRRLSPAR
jgi:hypothetical protein